MAASWSSAPLELELVAAALPRRVPSSNLEGCSLERWASGRDDLGVSERRCCILGLGSGSDTGTGTGAGTESGGEP
jgi:hypothetical protein